MTLEPTLALIQGLVLRPGARDVAPFAAYTGGQFASLVRGLAEDAVRGRRVALVTGAYLSWATPGAAETDGPVGVAALARALADAGARPVVITDERCETVVRACLSVVGLDGGTVVVPVDAPADRAAGTVAGLGAARLVAVERLGPNADGRVLTMKGVDITADTAPLHAAFESAQVPTGAIGDGGNEIGMANVPVDVVAHTVENGRTIAAATRVDHLVVAGTSNWGCYGVVAGLALLLPEYADRLAGLLDPALDEELLAAAGAVGGIDGVMGRPERSVDGVATDAYRGLMLALTDMANRRSAA